MWHRPCSRSSWAIAPRPSARSAEGLAALRADRIASIASAASAVALDHHLLVGECGSGGGRPFKPAAAFIWGGLQAGLSESAIAAAGARESRIDYGKGWGGGAGALVPWVAAAP